MLWHSKWPNAVSLRISAIPKGTQKGQKQILAAGGAKPSAPFPLSTSSALLPYFTMCLLRVILGKDPVTFECPIKRRGTLRAPAWAPFRHVADEQASAVPVNPARLHLPPTLWFFFMLTSSVCSASFFFFALTHFPPR